MIATLLFYLFSALLVTGAISVVCVNNPVKSVLSLVFCFLNAAALLIMTTAEFIAAVIVVVYVGAVVVLFLFVVMTLSTQEDSKRKHIEIYDLPFFIGIAVAVSLVVFSFEPEFFLPPTAKTEVAQNTQAVAAVLYTNSFLQFQLSALVLLIALIGAIVLSKRNDLSDVKKQRLWKQLTTDPNDRIRMINKLTDETNLRCKR